MCRYCEPNSTEQEMCVDCKRRYVRLSTNRSKLNKVFSSADVAKITRKILSDLDEYRKLQDAGCAIPNVVKKAFVAFEGVDMPDEICAYCGAAAKSHGGFHAPTRMCEECYSFYNYFNSLRHRPKMPTALGTRQAYDEMLQEISKRSKAGLRVPRAASAALREEGLGSYDEPIEANTARPKVNASIRRRTV